MAGTGAIEGSAGGSDISRFTGVEKTGGVEKQNSGQNAGSSEQTSGEKTVQKANAAGESGVGGKVDVSA